MTSLDAAERPDVPPASRWLDDPVESGPAAGFGVYLHVPFCAHRCGYCDFATWDDKAGWMDRYVAAVHDDIARTVAGGRRVLAPAGADLDDAWPRVTSVFVGGGTPTLLPPDDLAGLVERVAGELDLAGDAEVTVECNPETASIALFERLVAAGVTRVSMGAQSFAPHVLATLERQHGPERPVEAIAEARAAGIGEVNLDLIYGTPGERDEDWAETLRRVVAAGTDHVSAYALTIHDNTPFGVAVRAGAMPLPDEDVQAERFDVADDVLGAAGFEHYEVSNWARSPARRAAPEAASRSFRSRHNLLYWRHGDYLAFGVGAHAHVAGRRWWSHRSIPRYVTAIEAGASPVAAAEELSPVERAEERLMLGLRVREGLHPVDAPPLDPAALADAVGVGLVTTSCGRLQATDRGWFLLDEAVRRLM
ncbi:MAG: radical SAM family heme chaperone HemW [Actinobacteria bacterium]|nr:radical SAM family heme chaperone HemW [Actinomycetota bacterium]